MSSREKYLSKVGRHSDRGRNVLFSLLNFTPAARSIGSAQMVLKRTNSGSNMLWNKSTQERDGGWVDFRFPPPRLLSGAVDLIFR